MSGSTVLGQIFHVTKEKEDKMMKRMILALAAMTFSTGLVLADGGHAPRTPPTPAQIIAARVARFTIQLTLTTAQQSLATTIFTTELTALTAAGTAETAAQTALQTAIKANNGLVAAVNADSDVEKTELLASATASAAFYAILTATQRTTFDNLRLGGFDHD